MLTYRFLMFKMREITLFKRKITHFKRFAYKKMHFFLRFVLFFEKKHYFCR